MKLEGPESWGERGPWQSGSGASVEQSMKDWFELWVAFMHMIPLEFGAEFLFV